MNRNMSSIKKVCRSVFILCSFSVAQLLVPSTSPAQEPTLDTFSSEDLEVLETLLFEIQIEALLAAEGPELPAGCVLKPGGGLSCTGDEDASELKSRKGARKKAKDYCKSFTPPKTYVETSMECTSRTVEIGGRKINLWTCTTTGKCEAPPA